MTIIDYKIEWRGPYPFYSKQQETIFTQSEAQQQPGIYLWTVPYEGQYLTYYVGETGRSFIQRHIEHAQCYLHGLYRVCDQKLFSRGEKKCVWGGMWKKERRDIMDEFLDRYVELSSQIYEFLGLFRIFIAPFETNKHTRQRVEARIAYKLREQSGVVGAFQDPDIKFWPRRNDEALLCVFMSGLEAILGLDEILENC